MSIELRLTVTEMIWCGFQRRIGQSCVAIPTNEKSYGLEIYELQIQKRHELSTQSRLTVVQTIRVDANWARDASVTKSVGVNCNEVIIQEPEGYQSRDQ
jgi:hypothetical protein